MSLFAHRLIAAAVLAASVQFTLPGRAIGQETLEFREGLAIEGVVSARRYPLRIDAVERQIVAGTFTVPSEDDRVPLPDGKAKAWTKVTAGEDGAIPGDKFRSGYACWRVTVPDRRIMMLEATGHGMVYVNGEPRAGDPYGNGIMGLPVLLNGGENTLLFAYGRGPVRAKLAKPKAEVFIDTRDATLPDLPADVNPDSQPGAVLVVNATQKTLTGWRIFARDDPKTGTTIPCAIPAIPPLSVRKVMFWSPATQLVAEAPSESICPTELRGPAGEGYSADGPTVTFRRRMPGQTSKRTFISDIDGSVQYYAVVPASPGSATDRTAMVLSLHGASVEATGQADSYFPKPWATIICPTNRRPFGFDWEDWGRLDALEVLADASKHIAHDASRTYLTGHSMGGHGTWQLGALFPDRFAAIGPSAGWSSFQSYTGTGAVKDPDPVIELLQRAAASSETMEYIRNYETQGVYILHGDADDNVPVKQARDMREALSKFHTDLTWFEQPGAGHWWENSDEPGAECLDWPAMFDLFARRRLASDAETREVRFATPSPAISSSFRWAAIEAQIKPLKPSSIDLRFDPGKRRFTGTTDNVERLSLSLAHIADEPVAVELDGTKFADLAHPGGESPRLWLARAADGAWSVMDHPSPDLKGPHRGGLFKDAFRNRVQLIYGTKGTPGENAWAFAKARYDAETFWYRGNGSLEVIADTDFNAADEPDRNIVLYGNARTNAAWPALLSGSPVQVEDGKVRLGPREATGDDLACLFIRPRPGSGTASVGVVSGTGPAGMRLTDRLPYFLSGVGYPDVTILGPEMLEQGGPGVRATGYFGNDWSVERGEWAWRE
ncbi:MAG: prolyl oligopeptidase family serine peptidase [Phycisphaerales bacterium]|nr:prolyl oligopeptidase family serine peptidase [Phycisphaerales bacterium]